jgi:hypothetical protein
MRWIRGHLTYANVMATIAVFVALGGGAYAITTAQKNSVTSRSVKNSSLKGVDVLDESLTGSDVREGTLSIGGARPSGPAGGDLSGSYPDPQLGDGSVGAGEVADGSLRLADIAVWSSGPLNYTLLIEGNKCNPFVTPAIPGAEVTDALVTKLNGETPDGITYEAKPVAIGADVVVQTRICNVTGADITLPNPYGFQYFGLR